MKRKAQRSTKRQTTERDDNSPPGMRAAKSRSSGTTISPEFDEVLHLIEAARHRAFLAVNVELMDLYWNVGSYVSRKIDMEEWGKGTVKQLSAYIQKRQPGLRGFSPQNIWRMRQMFDAYRDHPILSTLLRELSWSSNLLILNKTKLPEEREFYLRMAVREGWQVREVARQINAAYFERSVLSPPKISPHVRERHPAAPEIFKDAYFLEFLGIPLDHSESDLHAALLRNLGRFITELGRDFAFIGSEYPVQVGGRDFALDLLFFHRGLSCLVAIELKIEEFQPEHLGKLEFYLEALDRDVRKPHEKPSIGLLLCATKDAEVVEYALARANSPALIAEYQTQLPDRAILQRKLHEFYLQLAPSEDPIPAKSIPKPRKKR